MNTKNKWIENNSLDAVIATPDSHKIILENEKVRVLEVIIKPHHKEPVHTHKWKSVMIVNSPARIRYFNAQGELKEYSKRNINLEKPLIEYLDREGPHAVENIDSVDYHAYRIEIKD